VAYPVQPDRPSILSQAQQKLRLVWDRATHPHHHPEPPPDEPPEQVEMPAEPAPARTRHRGRGWIIAGAVVGAIIVAILLFLAFFDWNYLRRPVAGFVANRIGRPVAIDGNLRVKLLSWTPSATVEGLRVANPPGRAGDMTNIKKLTVSAKLTPLLRGKLILPLVQADQPKIDLYRDAQGRNNWTFKGKTAGEPTRLPAIRRFEINGGNLRIEDGVRHLKFVGTVNSREVIGDRTVEGFKLVGDGTLNNEAFTMNLTGGPLLNVDPDRPYPFDADVRAGATRVLAKGEITRPFDLGVFQTTLDVTGPDMADLYYLTGLTLPNTPPYKVSGKLTRNDRRYRYTGMSGRVGDSDLHGWVGVTTGGKRPFLTGDVHSRVLDFKDLFAVIGGGSTKTSAGPIKASQVKVAQNLRASGRIFPDTPLNVDRLRRMDADVKYRADTIRSEKFPVRKGSVHVRLDNALLRLDDLTFTLTRGQLTGNVAINARQSIPVTDLDMRMTGARLEQFLPARFQDNSVNGAMIGRAKLQGVGRSVHDTASTASGTVGLVVPQGEIRKAFAELLGVNVVKGLGLLLSKNEDKTPIRCAVADFQASNGVLTAQNLVFDTGPVLVSGGGTVDLRNETMALRVKGNPKKFRLVRLNVPIRVEGRLLSPKIKPETGKAIGQIGIGAALGSVLAPLAAILPFVDNGLAKDANCSALIAGTATPGKQVAQSPAKPKG
jgi:AsmA family protein